MRQTYLSLKKEADSIEGYSVDATSIYKRMGALEGITQALDTYQQRIDVYFSN